MEAFLRTPQTIGNHLDKSRPSFDDQPTSSHAERSIVTGGGEGFLRMEKRENGVPS